MAADVERRLAAILSADVVGYSRLMAADESATVAALERYRERVDEWVRAHQGRLVDFTGDNFLAEFPTATDAVACACTVQDRASAESSDLPADRRVEFRIGIHVGEVRVESGRLYGSGVNTAARLEGLADPGGICISAAVFEQVRRAPGLAFDDLGEHAFKNLPDPVRAFRARGVEGPHGSAVRAADAPSVAVLPFVNMSPDPDQEYFADGMAEELINALTQVPGLRVIARTSAFSFKGSKADIATIGQRLGVRTIVEGSVRKAGDRLRITAQLIDVAGGHHLWSEAFDRSLDDVFEIQDEIARTIVTTIGPKLLAGAEPRLVGRATASRGAYELYLRAADQIARFDRRDTRTAIDMLKQATSLDPGFADAWARLALAYSQQAFAFDPDPRWHEEAEAAVRRAFEIDPDNGDAHFAQGRILWTPAAGFQHLAALRCFGRCLALQPGSQQPRIWRSLVLQHVGLLQEAREQLDEALAAQPDDPFTLNVIAQTEQFRGRFEEALEYLERAYREGPTLWVNHSLIPPLRLYLGDLAGAERGLERGREHLGDDPLFDSCEALLWAKRGDPARAEAALARAARERPSIAHTHHARHYAAAAHAVLGRPREAIAALARAAAEGLPNAPAFRTDPHLSVLRDEPDWKALLARVERDASAARVELARGGTA